MIIPTQFKNLETEETLTIRNLTCLCATVIVFMELIKLMSNLRGGEEKLGSLGGAFKFTKWWTVHLPHKTR